MKNIYKASRKFQTGEHVFEKGDIIPEEIMEQRFLRSKKAEIVETAETTEVVEKVETVETAKEELLIETSSDVQVDVEETVETVETEEAEEAEEVQDKPKTGKRKKK